MFFFNIIYSAPFKGIRLRISLVFKLFLFLFYLFKMFHFEFLTSSKVLYLLLTQTFYVWWYIVNVEFIVLQFKLCFWPQLNSIISFKPNMKIFFVHCYGAYESKQYLLLALIKTNRSHFIRSIRRCWEIFSPKKMVLKKINPVWSFVKMSQTKNFSMLPQRRK